MVMHGGEGYIDGVEFVRMGQMGVLGRYPFHWHLAGNVSGQYIKNSSIRNSYQRCLSVHGTHHALVDNNVCFNHFGHGFFLENGSETGNVISRNLSMVSKRIPLAKALLISDVRTSDPSRFSASSGFWISNPNNIVRGNVASGAQGTGIWMSFSRALRCNSFNHCEVGGTFPGTDVHPAYTRTLLFSDNIAHSADVGLNWDGAPDGALTGNARNPLDREIVAQHYFFSGPVFERCAVFKNRRTGIYYRGNTSEFRHLISADNADSLFFAYNQVVRDSLVVGLSANNTPADLIYLRDYLRNGQPIDGVRLYDGPFDLVNVHFAGFPSAPLMVGTWNATPIPFFAIGGQERFSNSVRGLTFSPTPLKKFHIDRTYNWQDDVYTSIIRDIDGSLTGFAGSVVRPNQPINRDASCSPMTGETAIRCQHRVGILYLGETGRENYTLLNINARLERNDGAAVQWEGSRYFNKVPIIMDNSHSYRLTFAPGAIYAALRMELTTDATVLSPVVELAGLKATCNLSAGYIVDSYARPTLFYPLQTSSLQQLQNLTSALVPLAMHRDPMGRVYVRFNPKLQHLLFSSANAGNKTTMRLDFGCP